MKRTILSTDILEEIRLLTNLETADQKLLQILLVGQPELDDKLDSVELRQLKQRIALRSHLCAVDLNETKGYIERRLQLAGSPDAANLFPQETIAAVYRHCRGIPRLINTICENALIAAYARQAPSVTPRIIDSIAIDFRLGCRDAPGGRPCGVRDHECAESCSRLCWSCMPTCEMSNREKRNSGRGKGYESTEYESYI